MERSPFPPLRALPRAFVPGIPNPAIEPIDLPAEEAKKFHSVLRLPAGSPIVLLPGDGRALICTFHGKTALPVETHHPNTEAAQRVTLALGLPKPEKLEESVRMATEIGVARILLFPSDRTVIRWDKAKLAAKIERLHRIAREAAEVCFRTHLPLIESRPNLEAVLTEHPNALVLHESDRPIPAFHPSATEDPVLVIGPEGGWSPAESARIGDRAVTLGPRVLRVDTAVAVACGLTLSASSPPASVS